MIGNSFLTNQIQIEVHGSEERQRLTFNDSRESDFRFKMALHEALLALQTGCSGLLTLKDDDPHFKKVKEMQ